MDAAREVFESCPAFAATHGDPDGEASNARNTVAHDLAVVGLGYVGLSLIKAAWDGCLAVIDYDTDPETSGSPPV